MALPRQNSSDVAANNRKRSRDNGEKRHDMKKLTKTTKGSAASSKVTKSQRMTGNGVVVLIIAIAVGMIWNSNLNRVVDPSVDTFWRHVCTHIALCGRMVHPIRRTLQAARPIRAGESLLEIPRSIQLWELDALRNDFVKDEKLLKARHDLTQNPLSGGAYLAVHLALEQQRLMPTSSLSTNNTLVDEAFSSLSRLDQARANYLHSLPTFDTLQQQGHGGHPILMSREDLRSLLGHHSWNFAVAIMYQEMVKSEYAALSAQSPIFGSTITVEDYQTSRIHVLTRSFNPGPEGCRGEEERLSKSEQHNIETMWGLEKGILFSEGCHAMVPILDMLNHHPQPNVVYQFDIAKQAFVISALSKIPVKWELIDSYGMHSDSHLFAKYGFVNGDGSGFTQASIAVFHRPLDVQMKNEFTLIPKAAEKDEHVAEGGKDGDDEVGIFSISDAKLRSKMKIPDFQKPELKRYLQYDDGYHECVEPNKHKEAFRLKQLKWFHLSKIANNPKSWITLLSPRSPGSKPVASSDSLITDQVPQMDPRIVRIDISRMMTTCRLLALTTEDYNGNAIQVLNDNMLNTTFAVARGSIALEYRALMFLGRLASTALLQYQATLEEEHDRVVQLNRENAILTQNWTAANLRLGEMQSLHAISGIAFGHAKKWEDHAKIQTEAGSALFRMRERSCPKSHNDLIDEDGLFD